MSDAAIVTFLFTDLVSSSDLYARLGDDAAERLRRTHFRVLRDAVTASGGHEVKSMGDGLMVVFPSAVEAVSCAVGMQQAVDRENRRSDAVPLGVRVGLHIGEPIRDEDDYFGQAVVIARRLCDAAQGGQIIVSDLVRTLVASRGSFAFRDLGPLELKGVPPTVAAEVVWERSTADAIDLPASLEPTGGAPFVARGLERERLDIAWKEASTGQRRLVLVAGEPGIGKTRLTSEFARAVHADGGVVLFGRCDEDVLVPYQPLVEALRHYVTSVPPDTLRSTLGASAPHLARIVPEIAERVSMPATDRGDPETERYRLFGSVATFLGDVSADAPVLVVIDDLHWADKPTLLLLRHIVREVRNSRLLLVATYRETELGRTHALDEVMGDLRREPGVERVALSGLASEEVADLLSRSAQHDVGRRGRRLADALHEITEGNPFFVLQVMGHLIETGRIYQQDGLWTFDVRIEEMGLPEGVKQVIGRRLSRLSETCNAVLMSASVIGREFEYPVLSAMIDADDDALIAAIDEALASGLVLEVRATTPTYAFSHALVRQTLYDEIHLARKQRLHLKAAEAIEQAHRRDADRFVSLIADHFRLAGAAAPSEKTLDYSLRAAQAAAAVFAWEETAAHLQGALEVLEDQDAPPDQRAGLMVRLGDLMYSAGLDLHAGIRYLERALELYVSIGDEEQAARTHSRLGRSLSTNTWVMDVPRAIAHYEEAEKVLSAGAERPALGYLKVGLSTGYMYASRILEGLKAAQDALAMAERLGNEQLWANAAILCGQHLIGAARLGEAFDLLERAWETADRLDNVFLSNLAANIYANWMTFVDPKRAVAFAEVELSRPRTARAGVQRLSLISTLCFALRHLGDTERLRQLSRAFDETDLVPFSADQYVSFVEGRWADRIAVERNILKVAERSGNTYTAGPVQWRLGLHEFYLSHLDVAEEHFIAALRVAETPGGRIGHLIVEPDIAMLYAWQRRADDMRPHIAHVRNILEADESWGGWRALVDSATASLAMLDGDRGGATGLFTSAVEVFRSLPLPWDEAHALHAWGRLLLQDGDASGHEKLDEAIAIYGRLGAGQPWTDWVEESRATAKT